MNGFGPREIVLAALTPAGGKKHSPVQVQKLLFLIDREAANLVSGPHFDFVPYNYGPFDSTVYRVLDTLDAEELVAIQSDSWRRTYALTPTGQKEGERLLDGLPEAAQIYIQRASTFVRSLTFSQLVSAIYKAYPEMRENSLIRSA